MCANFFFVLGLFFILFSLSVSLCCFAPTHLPLRSSISSILFNLFLSWMCRCLFCMQCNYKLFRNWKEYARGLLAMRLSIWIPGILGILGPIVIPIAHMVVLWFYWQNYARFVDRRFCSCSCWDTVFKGNQSTSSSL